MCVHDIPVPACVTMAQLADDSSYITASHRTSSIELRLQLAGNQVVRYFRKWGVSGPKSAAILFTRKLAKRHRPRTQINVWFHSFTIDPRIKIKMH